MENNDNFDLQKINSRYLALLSKINNERAIVDGLEKKVNSLEGDLTIIDGQIVSAKRAKDTTALEAHQKARKNILEQLKTLKEEAKIHKEDLTELSAKINKVLDQVRENPEIKQHIDKVLAKKYDRQNRTISKEMQKKEKEKEKADKRVKAIEIIKELVSKHPTLNNNLIGVLQNKAEIKKLLTEKQQLSAKTNKTAQDTQRIADIDKEVNDRNKKVDKNKGLILAYVKKYKIEITEQDIDELENHTVLGRNGQVNINQTIQAATKQYEKDAKTLENEISKQYKKFNINRQAIINLGQIPSEVQEKNTETKETNGNKEKAEITNGTEPKWWQFGKRFKAWNERRKQKLLGEGSQENEVASKIDTKHGEFTNSLKYEVVQRIVKQQARETERVARKDYNKQQQGEGREPGDD